MKSDYLNQYRQFVYNELIPRNDMTRLCFLTALLAVLILLGIKALEAK